MKPKDSRKFILAAGGVLLLLAVIYRFFPDIGDLLGPGQELGIKEKRVAKYRELVQQGDDQKARLMSLKTAVTRAESGLITGKTPSLAAADIQNILHKAAEKCQVKIKTVRVLKPEGADKEIYVSIPVQFTITSTVSQLKELIYRIESHSKYLKLTKVKSHAASKTRARLSARRVKGAKARTLAQQIRSEITVNGFFKKEGKEEEG